MYVKKISPSALFEGEGVCRSFPRTGPGNSLGMSHVPEKKEQLAHLFGMFYIPVKKYNGSLTSHLNCINRLFRVGQERKIHFIIE